MEEEGPRKQLIVSMHPLEPGQSVTLHVKRRHTKALVFGSTVQVEELGNLENPPQGIGAVKTGDVKLDGS